LGIILFDGYLIIDDFKTQTIEIQQFYLTYKPLEHYRIEEMFRLYPQIQASMTHYPTKKSPVWALYTKFKPFLLKYIFLPIQPVELIIFKIINKQDTFSC
jgi:hypothetical protein